MSSYGREVVESLDMNTTQVLSDGHDADWKSVGATLDWATVPANGSDTTLPDGQIIPAGVKFVRYGDLISEIRSGGSTGKVGPLRTDANDGRQTLEAGRMWVVNRTLRQDEVASDHALQLFDGGRVWEARLLVGGANQLALADVKAAFPRLSYTR